MTILKKQLLEEICYAQTRLDASKIPNVISSMFKTLEDQVMENASVQDKDNARKKEEVLENFKDAWSYAEKNIKGEIDCIGLTEVAGRVEPCIRAPLRKYADFRKGIVTFPSRYVAPADNARIMTHLDRMFRAQKEGDLHPVESAIFNYFQLIRIQPFDNGNKRTANIIMNTILRNNGFLPISIPSSESSVFDSYLVGALEGFKHSGAESSDETTPYLKPEFRQIQLYNFLARQELNALKCAEDKMAGLQHYKVSFESNSPAADYRLKHNVSGYLMGRSLPGQIKLDIKEKKLDIIGEIPYDTLQRIVNSVSGIRRPIIESY